MGLICHTSCRGRSLVPCCSSLSLHAHINESAMPPDHNITQLLIKWGSGDKTALDELIPLVYDELRKLAASYLRRRSGSSTCKLPPWFMRPTSGSPTSQVFQWNIARSSLAWRRRSWVRNLVSLRPSEQ